MSVNKFLNLYYFNIFKLLKPVIVYLGVKILDLPTINQNTHREIINIKKL